jgi:general secretion pathway protein K
MRNCGTQENAIHRLRASPGKQSGAALILVLTCLIALAGVVLLDEQAAFDKFNSVRLLTSEYEADGLAESGLSVALSLLAEDDSVTSDTQFELWAEPMTLGSVRISVEPCNARLDLNSLIGRIHSKRTRNAFGTLFNNKGYYPEYVDALMDWMDADADEKVLFAEGGWYEQKELEYSPPNRMLVVPEEALLVQGWGEVDPVWFEQYATLWNDSGRLNLNFVSKEVLEAYLPRLAGYWGNIEGMRRQEGGLTRVDQLLEILQGNELLYQETVRFVTMKSEYFRVIIEVDLPLVYEKRRYIVNGESLVVRADVLEVRVKEEAEAL